MSRMCIMAVSKLGENPHHLKTFIEQQVTKRGLAVFFSFDYCEPVFEHYGNDSLLCSIADSYEYDNCEMLLLPDNCMLNGRLNHTPFIQRMEKLSNIIESIKCVSVKIDLLIGYSGTDYQDFDIVYTNTLCFPATAEKLLNNSRFNDAQIGRAHV